MNRTKANIVPTITTRAALTTTSATDRAKDMAIGTEIAMEREIAMVIATTVETRPWTIPSDRGARTTNTTITEDAMLIITAVTHLPLHLLPPRRGCMRSA